MSYSILLFLLLLPFQGLQQPALDQLRDAYPRAIKEKAVCEKMVDFSGSLKNPTAVELAYSGAYKAVLAGHLSSPLQKLNTFKKGRAHLEQAVTKGQGNAEVHFLRLTIQYNAPNMLGYNNNMKQDLQKVLDQYGQIASTTLKGNIRNFLLETDLLSEAQRKKLN